MLMTMCPKCGKYLDDNTIYCPECGYPIDKKNKKNENRKKRKKRNKMLFVSMIVISILLLILSIILVIKCIEKDNTIKELNSKISLITANNIEVQVLEDNTSKSNSKDNEDIDDKDKWMEDIEVTVRKIDKIPEDIDSGIFSNYCSFEFTVNNKTKKPIKGIQGKFHVKDLFGKEFLIMNCDFTGIEISGGSSYFIDGLSYECNEFDNNDTKMYTTELEDLIFEYEPTMIIFTDNTSKSY